MVGFVRLVVRIVMQNDVGLVAVILLYEFLKREVRCSALQYNLIKWNNKCHVQCGCYYLISVRRVDELSVYWTKYKFLKKEVRLFL